MLVRVKRQESMPGKLLRNACVCATISVGLVLGTRIVRKITVSLVFTKRADVWLGRITVGVILLSISGLGGLYYYGPPEFTRVGYRPIQPVAFSHAQHVGQLGMSCLYCHSDVEGSPHANIPPTQICVTCHQQIKPQSPTLTVVQASWKSGDPIPWVRVHKTPDHVFFNHAIHVVRGIGCESCHGRINEMAVVAHDQPLSMAWCLDCHRHPEDHLRPAQNVTDMGFGPPDRQSQHEFGLYLKNAAKIKASEDCTGCHR
jgi:Cytochrome c7 and related cytochrome c